MLRILLIAGLCLFISILQAQNVGVNETGLAPHPSAMLDIDSPDKGILIPRLADHTAIAAPAQGLLVYNTTDNGFWYWDGTQWLPLLGGNAGWQILGNNGINPSINYLGTNDAAALMVKVNNTHAGRVDWDMVLSGSTVGRKGATALGYQALASNSSGARNSAFGFNAGSSLTTGHNNSIFGFSAGESLTTGDNNTFLGVFAGQSLTGGVSNTFVGSRAALAMATGSGNLVLGTLTARDVTAGERNLFIGSQAALTTTAGGEDNVLLGERTGQNFNNGNRNILLGNLAGFNLGNSDDNILIGYRAGYFAYTAVQNIFIGYRAGGNAANNSQNNILIGYDAGRQITSGNENTVIGTEAAATVSTGFNNVYIGHNAGRGKQTADSNVAIGWNAMSEPQVGSYIAQQSVAIGRRAGAYCGSIGNVYVGYNSGLYASTAPENTFVGARTGEGIGTTVLSRPGQKNTFIGFQAGRTCRQGCERNTFLGSDAGSTITTGFGNVYIGYSAGLNFPGHASNLLLISNGPDSTDVLVYGEFVSKRVGINTVEPAQTLSVDGDAGKDGGGDWIAFSDRRVKNDIAKFSDGLDVVLNLNPVTYRYNKLSGYKNIEKEYVGFIAQEVEEVAPYMVTLFDDSEGPSGLKDKRVLDTSALNQIFVNAFKEQQKEIESLESRVEQLEKLVQKLLDAPEAIAEKK